MEPMYGYVDIHLDGEMNFKECFDNCKKEPLARQGWMIIEKDSI